ncbi:hypothetical protein CBR_g78879 [Chara braunii]|uniref:Secreted protein n=1 Tax=Chara braunii TaxID=69332 RepID=A0A388KAK8_CHABU|nr:hypothetical protein CBR_g78879 [Chara braunii]|eukprot:GBG67098.1 hypothetical protein CBR_g78879 [Chara braunii]
MAVFILRMASARSAMATFFSVVMWMAMAALPALGQCNFDIEGYKDTPPTVRICPEGDVRLNQTNGVGPIIHNVNGTAKNTTTVNANGCGLSDSKNGPWDYDTCNRVFSTWGNLVHKRTIQPDVKNNFLNKYVRINITQVTYPDNSNWNGQDCLVIKTPSNYTCPA